MFKHPEIERMVRVGRFVHEHGWAEGNAGNMSVRLSGEVKAPRPRRGAAVEPLGMAFPALAGEKLLFTATGRRMRDFDRDPAESLVLIEVLPGGRTCRVLWGAGRPTSELLCHLAVHDICVVRKSDRRAVLHVHSPCLIAASHLPALQPGTAFVDALQRVHPEAGVLVGLCGFVLVPFMVGSTPELAAATREALRRNDLAMWSMHGLVAAATEMETALDRAEMAERAAQLYLLRLAADPGARGLSDEQLAAVRAVFCPREQP